MFTLVDFKRMYNIPFYFSEKTEKSTSQKFRNTLAHSPHNRHFNSPLQYSLVSYGLFLTFFFFLFVQMWDFFLCIETLQLMVFLLSFRFVIVDIYAPHQITKKLKAIFCIVCLPEKECIFDFSSTLNGDYHTDPAWKLNHSPSTENCRTVDSMCVYVCVCVHVHMCVCVFNSFTLKKPPKRN